jgi:hypothetical protein
MDLQHPGCRSEPPCSLENGNVSDRLVFEPVRLPLERLALDISDGLPDLCHDRAIRSSIEDHGLDVRTDHGPLARPVLAYGVVAMDVATIHTVGAGDIIGEHCQHAVYIPRNPTRS